MKKSQVRCSSCYVEESMCICDKSPRVCQYPKCTNAPKCRAEDPEYCVTPSHSTYADSTCPSPFNHKWICDAHWDLLEFIRNSDVFEFDVTFKRR